MQEIKTGWEHQRERGSALMLKILFGIARLVGRRSTRLLLWPITAYFLITGRSARKASRIYLSRLLEKPPRWTDVARHFFTFASVSLDRFYFLTSGMRDFELHQHVPIEVDEQLSRQRGCLLLLSHHGGFDALRLAGVERNLRLRVLMDLEHGRKLVSLLEKLHPTLTEQIIDASQRGPQLVLKLKEALEQGTTIATMGDRVTVGSKAVPVTFLGGRVHLPTGPWILAAALQAPIIIGFGLFRGRNCYDVHFELLDPEPKLSRVGRDEAIQVMAQRYIARLEHYVRLAPYNWFNFYDFWEHDPPSH